MKFEINGLESEITVIGYEKAFGGASDSPPYSESFEYEGVFIKRETVRYWRQFKWHTKEVVKELCPIPDEVLRAYHNEIVEALKEDK